MSRGIKVPDFILQGTISTKTAFSAIFYEKSVQEKIPEIVKMVPTRE